MNKGVTIAGGVILLLSVILTVAGGAITANSGENLENIDDSPQPFYTASEGGSTTFAFIDEDLAGSLAFQVLLDLDYDEDSTADTDLNIVMNDKDELIEIQGTAEDAPFSKKELDDMLVMGSQAIADIIKKQKACIE